MSKLKTLNTWICLLFLILAAEIHGKSEPGKTNTILNPNSNIAREQRPLLAGSRIYVKVECDTKNDEKFDISISWTLKESKCWYEPNIQLMYNSIQDFQPQPTTNQSDDLKTQRLAECPNHLIVLTDTAGATDAQQKDATSVKSGGGGGSPKSQHPLSPTNKPIFTITKDGVYNLEIQIDVVNKPDAEFSAPVSVEILGPHGYISATDWPLLPFYGIMCVVYVIFGIIWLVVSFMQWRDLLRIQFWIGGVILLGMLEKAFFYAEYHSLNVTGESVQGAELAAEFVSCAKRTLARMLVIIMSLGFGIVKPRLGPMLHRVVGVGALYFVLAAVESYLRVMRTKTDERNELLVASIPLAVLDTGICWWIFTSLVQTTRTLRLRRNMVKLSLYRHFTNTLIFSVIASVIFMIAAMRMHKTENCTPGWHQIWIDTAFWHVLFSVLLLVIMILWRPTNNNQRYAFTPLLDNPEDEDEDEEDQFVADAYGVKMRSTGNGGSRTPPMNQRGGGTTNNEEDDLRWVEENIPSSMSDPTLPVLDSDEEIISTKFEVSKMQ